MCAPMWGMNMRIGTSTSARKSVYETACGKSGGKKGKSQVKHNTRQQTARVWQAKDTHTEHMDTTSSGQERASRTRHHHHMHVRDHRVTH